jgi:FADH2 O2-dependent halogenase
MKGQFDIAVVGSGFAGSLMAMIAKRLGRSVILLDKGKHPRVAIGESSTPLTNLLLEELATQYDLPALRPLVKWGSWQRRYPEIACGLKRGFTFYHHDLKQPESRPPGREKQLLVAASPNDEIADTHWYRADFDRFLVSRAQELGIEYYDEVAIDSLFQSETGVRLTGVRNQQRLDISAKFLIDASGPRGFLHRALGLREIDFADYPATQALYNHFTGVGRLQETPFGANEDRPPYPIDAAAVHHVFDSGWIWVLQFNNGVTSAGIAASGRSAADLGLADGEVAWRRILEKIPALAEQFAEAMPERSFTHLPKLSFLSSSIAGERWAMLPSAAGFVDPMLSTGFPLTLLGIARLAKIIEHDWETSRIAESLQTYARQTREELYATSRLISALYTNMGNSQVFSALTLLYFAAASYSETARRLGKDQLATSFLLHDHPFFGPVSFDLLGRAQAPLTANESELLVEDIFRAIEPIDVAGLGNGQRRNWYPVDADDLVGAAWKVEATQSEIAELLHRCGFPMTQTP